MPKILAIDDSPTLRKFISKHLGAHSSAYEVITAADGYGGLEAAKAQQPDIILLDFVLPDINGEEVCSKLLENESTSAIPIILMSSSAADITRTEAKFDIVKKSLIKPFSPQLLCAAVSALLKQIGKDQGDAAPAAAPTATASTPSSINPESQPTMMIPRKTKADEPATETSTAGGSSKGKILIKGSTSYFPLISALRGIDEKCYTGTFRLNHPAILIEVYFKGGGFVLASSKDTDAYFKDAPIQVSDEERPLMNEMVEVQKKTGCPVFLQMSERGAMSEEDADQMTLQYSNFIFALAWTALDADFEFEEMTDLPEFLKKRTPIYPTSDAFALESLRNVGEECLTAIPWGPPTGVPAYTRAGYERIQKLSLNEQEVAFATQVAAGGQNLEAIANAMGVHVKVAQCILFRFLALEVFDYWTAAE